MNVKETLKEILEILYYSETPIKELISSSGRLLEELEE